MPAQLKAKLKESITIEEFLVASFGKRPNYSDEQKMDFALYSKPCDFSIDEEGATTFYEVYDENGFSLMYVESVFHMLFEILQE